MDKSYVRCLTILMAGAGWPMIATHDPRLIAIAAGPGGGQRPPDRLVRVPDAVRHPAERAAPAGRAGHPVRVYMPYGVDWYGYFMRRLAERPANVAFFLRALATAVVSRLAVLGAGKLGEALLSGLLRAGRPADDIVVVVRRPERAKELEERYGVQRGAGGRGGRARTCCW